MDQRHKKIIKANYQELADVTQDIDTIIKEWAEMGFLNEYMVDFLNSHPQQRRRTLEFYEMSMGRGPRAFEGLHSVLRRTGNFRAEKILSSHKVTIYDTVKPEMLCSPMDELDIGPSKRDTKTEIVVRKHPDDKFMDSADEGELRNTYRMRSYPRGYALLININKTPGRKDRGGSNIDILKLESLFQQLGFKVIKKKDLTDQEIKDEIQALKTKPELINVDCSIVFVMCHGSQRTNNDCSIDLWASNGVSVNSNWIADQFQSKDVTLPEGKPRLFFFQACRVPKKDEKENKDASKKKQDVETDSEVISKGQSAEDSRQPLYLDTFIGYSTIPGNYSMRHPEQGSWFVEVFCDVIAENAWKYDLDDMWREIDSKLRKKDSHLGQQTSEQVKRAFNKLFFNPHLYEKD